MSQLVFPNRLSNWATVRECNLVVGQTTLLIVCTWLHKPLNYQLNRRSDDFELTEDINLTFRHKTLREWLD